MNNSTIELRERFTKLFGGGGKIHVVRAPGRVNLIGEHTDYNEGFVLPMAIEPEIRFVCRSRDDGLVRLASTAFAGEITEFSVNRRIERASGDEPTNEPTWTNYPRG